MSSDDVSSRFEAVRMRLKEARAESNSKEDTRKSRFARPSLAGEVDASAETDIATTEAFKILTDTTLDAEEKIGKLFDLLTFKEDDLEKNVQLVEENRAIVAQLLADFTLHNKKSIELVRDNPLTHLRTGIKDVFDEYHALVGGRSDLKEKLELIDDLIAQKGGPQGLIDAMLAARDKEVEKNALEKAMNEATADVSKLTAEKNQLGKELKVLDTHIVEAERDMLLFFKGEKKKLLTERRKRKEKKEVRRESNNQELEVATLDLKERTDAYAAFTSTEDWMINERILEILDIGNEQFIERVKALSDLTLSYIDNTEDTLTGVRDQLESLLKRVISVHTLTHNTKENVAIVLEAQQRAQKQNAAFLQKFEDAPEKSGMDALEHEKKKRGLNQHISAIDKTIQSTAAVAGELGKIESSLTNFKDQMEEGLADAIEQQMLAVGSAAVSGNNTLMRIEGLATFVQSVITKGQYAKESEEALGDLAKDMERALMGRMAKNASIKDLTAALKEMSDAIDVKNDVVLEIAEERKDLIDRLITQSEELGRANEDALAIEATVNKKIYTDQKQDGG